MNEHAKPESQGANNHGDGNSRSAGFGDAPRFTVDKKKWPKNEAVAGPFTVRDLTVFGSTLLLFVASLVPVFALGLNLWNLGNLFFLGLGVVLPLAVCALFVARRLSPKTRVRVGSLSVDQFASVVASFTLAFFFLAVASAFVPFLLVALLGALGLFAATVLARLIPFFAGDFLDRPETPSHVAARHTAVPAAQPKRAKPAGQPGAGSGRDTSAKDRAPGASAEPVSAGLSAGIDKVSDKVSGWARRLGSSEHKPESAENEAQPGPSAAQRPAGSGAAAAATPPAVVPLAPEGTTRTPASPAATQTREATAAGGGVQANRPAPAQSGQAQSDSATSASATTGSGTTGSGSSDSVRPDTARTPGAQAPAAQPGTAPAARPGATAAEQTQVAAVPSAAGDAPTAVHPQVRREEPIGATVDPSTRPNAEGHPAHEAFWFAVAQPRTAVDERTGAPVFVIEPGGWVLALEDRGTEFLVQNTDGKVGVLRELNNIERG